MLGLGWGITVRMRVGVTVMVMVMVRVRVTFDFLPWWRCDFLPLCLAFFCWGGWGSNMTASYAASLWPELEAKAIAHNALLTTPSVAPCGSGPPNCVDQVGRMTDQRRAYSAQTLTLALFLT